MEDRTNLSDSTLKGIQELIEINIDSFEGYRKASEIIEDDKICKLLCDFANERESNTRQLKSIVFNNDEEPVSSGSLLGQAHRWWMNVKAGMSNDEVYSALASAEKGEDAIKKKYETVIKETTGNAVNDILHKQYLTVKKQHDKIRDLRDIKKAAVEYSK